MKHSTETFLKEINEVCKKHKKFIGVSHNDALRVYAKHWDDDYLGYLLSCEDETKGDK